MLDLAILLSSLMFWLAWNSGQTSDIFDKSCSLSEQFFWPVRQYIQTNWVATVWFRTLCAYYKLFSVQFAIISCVLLNIYLYLQTGSAVAVLSKILLYCLNKLGECLIKINFVQTLYLSTLLGLFQALLSSSTLLIE